MKSARYKQDNTLLRMVITKVHCSYVKVDITLKTARLGGMELLQSSTLQDGNIL